jgi:uncharacterized cupin superfamily protein
MQAEADRMSRMRKANLHAPEFGRTSERDGYRWRAARIGEQIGAEQIGATLYELPDGERICPYHFHHGVEELLLVVSGSPTLRGPDGERTLAPGELVSFPTGPDGAHQLRGPGSVLLFSANRSPEVAEYPDSGKVGIRPGKNFRAADAVDYWEGE